MNSKRLYYLFLGLIVLAIAGICGGAYNTNTLLTKQSGNLVSLKAKVAALDNQKIELKRSKEALKTYKDLYKISKVIVPQSKNQTQTVRQIVALAADNGIALQGITFPVSNLGSGAAAAGAAKSAAPIAPAAGAPKAATGNPDLSQLAPVPQIPGVYKLELVVTSSADTGYQTSFPNLIQFLSSLEQNRLTALVSKITISPSVVSSVPVVSKTTEATYSFILTLDVYVKPGK